MGQDYENEYKDYRTAEAQEHFEDYINYMNQKSRNEHRKEKGLLPLQRFQGVSNRCSMDFCELLAIKDVLKQVYKKIKNEQYKNE